MDLHNSERKPEVITRRHKGARGSNITILCKLQVFKHSSTSTQISSIHDQERSQIKYKITNKRAGGSESKRKRSKLVLKRMVQAHSSFDNRFSRIATLEIILVQLRLWKDVAIRPPSGDEEVLPSAPKDESEEDDNSKLVARVQAGVSIQKSSESAEADEGALAEVHEPERVEATPSQAEMVSVLYHEAFLRIQEEHKAEVRDLTKKNDTYKLLSEKLQADLVTARDEHAEMTEQVFRVLHDSEDELEITTNDPILQNKETVQAQLDLAETQLQASKEKASVQVEKIKEHQSQLDLAVSDEAILANELEVARSKVTVANTKADAKVAQFRVDVEAIQGKAKGMVDHAKWQARREALERVHPQSFDIMAEIENAKEEEARARRLAFPEEDSESSSEAEDGENLEDGDATSDEYQAT
ncbi:uncharacterized protein [Nicotiana tomentosiformis]|uniref:uncharacterized protein n=1 Tax=Nicotiana tomentosiformis TaxID=4098 RepID=UPI00388CDDB6